jgi:hypothetical protein
MATPHPPFHESWRKVGAAVATIAFLPFLKGILLGRCFYYRDIFGQFFPLRRFAVEGLRHGELWYWNPFSHEGEQLAWPPPLSYPVDLLQVLWPDERGFSLLLALHVPAAALAFMALGRRLGLGPAAAGGAGVAYALGGFTLSCLNLYFYLPAVAWAPLVILGLLRAAEGGKREVAQGGLLAAVALSTLGLEIVLQTLVIGTLMAIRLRAPARLMRVAGVGALAFALASPVLLLILDLLPDTQRAAGLAVSNVLANSIHPLALVQVVVAGFFGDLSRIPQSWWGGNFFVAGFPYFQSLYLGATLLCLAGLGARSRVPLRLRLLVIGTLALVITLGWWGGLGPLVEAMPFLRILRFPSKAFFTVHLIVCLFAGFGLQELFSGAERAWRRLAGATLVVGALLVAALTIPWVAPAAYRWFLEGFLSPSGRPWTQMDENGMSILLDAARGGVSALLVGVIGVLVARGRLGAAFAGMATVGLLSADLVRAGADVNPMVPEAFYRLSAEMAEQLPAMGPAGRLFTCDTHRSVTFNRELAGFLKAGRPTDPWAYNVFIQTLTPFTNVPLAVRSAYGYDPTGFISLSKVLDPGEATCLPFAPIADRLRRAGVRRVISLDPIEGPGLDLDRESRPAQVAPLTIHTYSLRGSLPLRIVASSIRRAGSAADALDQADLPFLQAGGTVIEDAGPEVAEVSGGIVALEESPGRLRIVASAPSPTAVVVRDSYAPGWTARVNGSAAPVARADARYLAVRIPAGQSEVLLRYSPPHLRPGVVLCLVGLVVMAGLWFPGGHFPRVPTPTSSA